MEDYKECTDCVHYEFCLSQEKYLIEHNRKDLIRRYGFGLHEVEHCKFFKDRSRFVELPCKVGDTVYLLHNVYNNILAYSVSKILINSGEPIIEIVEAERRIHFLHLPARELNKSLFFTKEQAEQALKERENK